MKFRLKVAAMLIAAATGAAAPPLIPPADRAEEGIAQVTGAGEEGLDSRLRGNDEVKTGNDEAGAGSDQAGAGSEVGRALNDTLHADTARAKSSLDTTIVYTADSVSFSFNPRRTVLKGRARIAYRTMVLEADRIEILWDSHLLFAEGRLDTVRRDTTGADTVMWRGLPKLDDGAQVVTGQAMTYHLKTRQGRVVEGRTTYQDGYYTGGRIKRVDDRVYNIRSGFYTTCKDDHPHYGFWSRDMKLVVKDRVIARPVVLYFAEVPVMILPFGVFPAHGGRHSGIIVPTYGESASQGRYFTNLGYYWAPSDYTDARASLDFYERYGILLRGDMRYALRYHFSGGLSGSYVNQRREGRVERRWDAKLGHSQTLSPTTNLVANGYFVSDGSYLRDLSLNQDERLKQQIRSDATLTKRWAGTPYSGSVNVNYQEDLTTGESARSLPRLSLSRNSSPLFPMPTGASTEDARWFNSIYWNYRAAAENRRDVRVARSNFRYEAVGDTLIYTWDEDKVGRDRGGVRHDIGFNSSFKLGYLNLTPRLNYNETWLDEWLEYSFNDRGVPDTVKHTGFIARRTFNAGFGLNTKLYGIFKPRLIGVEAIRHTLSPSAGFTYQPDFSTPFWGYYDVWTDTLGRKNYYDRFSGNIYGGTPRQLQQAISLSVDNLFEYKRRKGEEEVRGELFSASFATAHDLAADSLKWRDLSSTVRFKPFGAGGAQLSGFAFDLGAAHSFYALAPDPTSGRKRLVNRAASEVLRLVNFDLTTSFNIKGGRGSATLDTAAARKRPTDRFEGAEWTPSPAPWDAGVGLRYGEDHRDPDDVRKNFWGSLRLEVQATPNWKVSYDSRYDLLDKRVVGTSISLYRDLHCWEGRLVWTPSGIGRGYYLRINVKSPSLQDVKVEKREGGGGYLGF